MKTRIATTALALSLTATLVAAEKKDEAKPKQEKPQSVSVDRTPKAVSAEVQFARYDTNKDGQVTAQEFRGGKTLFEAYDADRNGILTVEEIKVTRQSDEKPAPNFRALDTDKDGFVSRREWQGTQEEFDAVDVDNDGVWSKEDRALEKSRTRAQGLVNMFDTDKDGVISQTEWQARNRDEASFRRYDLNRNGSVDADELAAATAPAPKKQ